MKIQNMVNNFIALGIYLFLWGDNLKYRAPQGDVTDEVINLLRKHKQSLIILLKTGNPYNLPMVIKPSIARRLVADLLFWAVRWMLIFLSKPNYKLQRTFKIKKLTKTKKKLPTGAMTQLIHDDCNNVLDKMSANSIDAVITDPPYGLNFMGKDWDKAIPSVNTWKKCFRVMKHGAWIVAFSSPRQDLLSRMIANLEKAGFDTGFTSIYWAYANGAVKSFNISNSLRKKGRSSEAEELEGAYAGFQPKPAVEVIIFAMKPLKEKTYTAQALSNGKGITWLDDCRIPYGNEMPSIGNRHKHGRGDGYGYKPQWKAKGGIQWTPEKEWKQDIERQAHEKGRVPANLIVSDGILDDGKKRKVGIFSNFFSLDVWARKNYPFFAVPKASKKEKESGCEGLIPQQMDNPRIDPGAVGCNNPRNRGGKERKNIHPTPKPVELMRYLVTMTTRPGDTIFDLYAGTGTTCLAAQSLGRRSIGTEIKEKYCKIAKEKIYDRRIENYFGGTHKNIGRRSKIFGLHEAYSLTHGDSKKAVKPQSAICDKTHQTDEAIQIVNADFYTWSNDNLEPDSIDLILTDPPYPKKYLHLWDQLGEVAANVLKPDGYLVSYSGLYYLPTVIEALDRHLTYIWVIALHHKGKTQLVFPSNVISTYKPILIFRKGEIRKFNKTIPDSITSDKRDKRYHKWGQGEKAVGQLIETFSERNGLVFDPFAGGGTTLAAAKKLGRRCIGTEIDPKLIDVIKKRLEK